MRKNAEIPSYKDKKHKKTRKGFLLGNAMSKKSETVFKSVLGAVFIVMGLVILGFVSMTAFQLATGVIKPLKIVDEQISSETGIFSGIALQIGLFVILVLIAYILIKLGLTLILREEERSKAQVRPQI